MCSGFIMLAVSMPRCPPTRRLASPIIVAANRPDCVTKETTRPLTKGEAERVGEAVRSFEQPPSRRRFGEPREIAETAEIGELAERVVTRSGTDPSTPP